MACENNKNNNVVAFKGSNEIDYNQDFDPNFYLDYEERNYIDLNFILQKLHLNKEQKRILFGELRKLKKHIEDEIEADRIEFEAMEREHEAKMAHYKFVIETLDDFKNRRNNGEDLDTLMKEYNQFIAIEFGEYDRLIDDLF